MSEFEISHNFLYYKSKVEILWKLCSKEPWHTDHFIDTMCMHTYIHAYTAQKKNSAISGK